MKTKCFYCPELMVNGLGKDFCHLGCAGPIEDCPMILTSDEDGNPECYLPPEEEPSDG